MKQSITRAMVIFTWIAITPLLGASSCDDPLISNEGFDQWCGAELCVWDTHEGEVEQTPTWHESDLGVALVGNPVVISQLSEYEHDPPRYISYELMAEVDEGVRLVLETDYNDDGVTDLTQNVVSDNFNLFESCIPGQVESDSARFTLKKFGEGRAVLGQIGIYRVGNCNDH